MGGAVYLSILLAAAGWNISDPVVLKKAQDLPVYQHAADPDFWAYAIPDRIIVKFRDDYPVAQAKGEVEATLLAAGAVEVVKYSRTGGNWVVVRLPKADPQTALEYMERVMKDPRVEYAEPDMWATVYLTPNDPRWSQQWGPPAINAPQAWDITTGSSSIKIAVIDQGVQYDHPDLSARFGSTKGYDFVSEDNDPYPVNSQEDHGTHVAGIIAATINNGVGIAGMAQVTLLSFRALNERGSGTYSDIADAVRATVQYGVKVANMSLGGPSSNSTLQSACDYAYNNGVLLIAASGNDGRSSISYPAAYASVVAVGALASATSLASYSNYGSAQEVVAPGSNILSTVPFGNYANMSGTSMASPHVAGVAGLIFSVNPSLSNQQARDILRNTAVDLGASGWDQYYGYGRVNAYAAVQAAQGGGGNPTPPPPPPDQGNHQGGPDGYGYTWIDSHVSGGPQFTWYTVSTRSSLNGDDATITLNLPFAFPFYGQTFTSVIVGSNGVLQFGSPALVNPYSNSRLPMSSAGRMIAAFWDDLTVLNAQGSYVYYGSVGSDKFVIEWRNARRYGDSTASYTFQVILVSNGDVYVSYKDLSGTVTSSTVGIQDGSLALQVTYNGSNSGHPAAGSTIYFKAPRSAAGHQGGPDGGGYRWIDSHVSGGPSYLWYDRDNTWTDLGINGDDVGKWVTLPFNVNFYGQSYSRVYVSSNGVMFFTTAANPYNNGPIPNGSYSYFLAPFWDDLTAYSSNGSRVYVKAVSSTRVVFLFENLRRYGDNASSYTFEVILDANGTVHFSYGRMSGTVASATVGIQGGSGTGLQVTYNGSYSGHPEQGLTIRFSPGAVKGGVAGFAGEGEGVYLAQRVVGGGVLLRLVVGSPERVRVDVLDGLGRVVVGKDYGVMAPGVHRVGLDLGGVPAGVYFLRVVMGERTYREKFVVR